MTFPHHRAAYGSWLADIQFPAHNRHIFYGALVGGPASGDTYADDRAKYQESEVACDYNAGLLGVLARMCIGAGTFTPLAGFPAPELSIIARQNAGGSWGYQPMIRIINKTAWPPRVTDNLSVRFFFTIESGKSISNFTVRDNGGSCAGRVSGPHLFRGDIYYALIDLGGVELYPGGYSAYALDVYLTINDNTNSYNAANDWSAAGLSSAETETTYITIYEAGTRVWG